MATESKIFKLAIKRSASGSPIETEQASNQVLQVAIDWANDHEFIAPNEIYINAIGLLFPLVARRLINISFTDLYHRSLKITWMDLLNRERRNLKSNINSVEKCFIINRLIAACKKNPYDFARQTGELYEEIKMRMSSTAPTSWAVEDFYGAVRAWRNLQCQRRLFHMNYDEANQPHSLLTLQHVATKFCSQFMDCCQINVRNEERNRLRQLIQHSFIIVAQPSVAECVAATKYEKLGNTYSAKLHTRIICLLDPDVIEKYFKFSNVDVRLYPLARELDQVGEAQPELEWSRRTVINAEEELTSFSYVELDSIQLSKLDVRSSRPLYSAKLCQLQFQITIRMNKLNIEENLTFLSQPFGLCSHAQYYPEYIAKVLIYEVTQMPQNSGSVIQPNMLKNFVCRYHTRISGIELKLHTCQYIMDQLRTVYEEKKKVPNSTSFDIYEEILAKLISQMEFFIDHPFLSMMYHDGLFLGICNNILDQQLHGTRERPYMLLRFNNLATHSSTQHASVRYIVHNGQLTRATFHTKTFVDEMCRMVCEANSDNAKKMQILSETPNKNFHEFTLYFDNELFRLNSAAAPIKDAYQPLIPVLWNTMRINTDEQSNPTEQKINSPSSNSESTASNSSLMNQIQNNFSNVTMTSDSSKASNENVTIQIDTLVHHLVEKLSDLLIKSPADNISSSSIHMAKASVLLSTLTSGDVEQQKLLLSHLTYDYLQSITYVEVATQTSTPASSNSPVNISDDITLDNL